MTCTAKCDLQGCARQGTGGSAGTDTGAQQQHMVLRHSPILAEVYRACHTPPVPHTAVAVDLCATAARRAACGPVPCHLQQQHSRVSSTAGCSSKTRWRQQQQAGSCSLAAALQAVCGSIGGCLIVACTGACAALACTQEATCSCLGKQPLQLLQQPPAMTALGWLGTDTWALTVPGLRPRPPAVASTLGSCNHCHLQLPPHSKRAVRGQAPGSLLQEPQDPKIDRDTLQWPSQSDTKMPVGLAQHLQLPPQCCDRVGAAGTAVLVPNNPRTALPSTSGHTAMPADNFTDLLTPSSTHRRGKQHPWPR